MRKLTAILVTLAMTTLCACSDGGTSPRDEESFATVTATDSSSTVNRDGNETTKTTTDDRFNSNGHARIMKMSDTSNATKCKEKEDIDTYEAKSEEVVTSAVKTTSIEKAISTTTLSSTSATTHTELVTEEATITTATPTNAGIITETQQTYYTVKGDCWSSVAEKFGIWPPEILMQANPQVLTNDINSLAVGVELHIPTSNTWYEQEDSSSYSSENSNNNYNYSEEYVQHETFLGDATIYSSPDSASWHNLTLVLDRLNGMTLYPGETFNFNARFGDTTEEDGFVLAPEYGEGSNRVYGYGGGVCVSSTALFQAARNAGLNIIDNQPHSGPCSYAPNPEDQAAISNGSKNLIFSNNCGSTVIFYTSYEYGYVYVSCYKLS